MEMFLDICMMLNHTMGHGFELISRNLRVFRVKSLGFGLRYDANFHVDAVYRGFCCLVV